MEGNSVDMNHNGNGFVDRKQKGKGKRGEKKRKNVSNYNEIKFAPKLSREKIFYLSSKLIHFSPLLPRVFHVPGANLYTNST